VAKRDQARHFVHGIEKEDKAYQLKGSPDRAKNAGRGLKRFNQNKRVEEQLKREGKL
jgi:hypothetical protein